MYKSKLIFACCSSSEDYSRLFKNIFLCFTLIHIKFRSKSVQFKVRNAHLMNIKFVAAFSVFAFRFFFTLMLAFYSMFQLTNDAFKFCVSCEIFFTKVVLIVVSLSRMLFVLLLLLLILDGLFLVFEIIFEA